MQRKKVGILLNITSWWVGTGVYLDDINRVITGEHKKQVKGLNRLLVQFTLLAICLIIIAFLVAIYLAEIISKPIISLSHIAKRIASGDYHARTDLKHDDELGDMAQSFNVIDRKS